MWRSARRTSRIVSSSSTAIGISRERIASAFRIRKAAKSTANPPAVAPAAGKATPPSTAAATSRTRIQRWWAGTLVQNPKVKESLPLIGNGAYLILGSGFIMTDMLTLRVALVCGYSGLVAFHSLHPRPLKIPLRWSAFFVLVNAAAASMLAMDRWGAPLSEEEEDLYQNHFAQLTKGQFYQLLSMGRKLRVPDGTVLTREGRACPRLYFIEKGTAKVFHHGAFASSVDCGGFVNDVAFQREEEGAYGTIVAAGECSIIAWDQAELRGHLKGRSDMDRNIKYLLSEHLMKSLLKQREARRWNQKLQEGPGHKDGLARQLQLEGEEQIQYP